ncbi:hypothetical protein [Spirabiliibacterium mucosae]|uniref:hypothetical protein n=1 Tax=Spirabiliibacterium mucosae TaxID=28156 RepID=UPI00249DEC47|nr:hypothetical protein [Spirabiliibacterium mucosae]
MLSYKTALLERNSPQTTNLRIQAMNRYTAFIGKPQWRMKLVKVQQKNFLENVISQADYYF